MTAAVAEKITTSTEPIGLAWFRGTRLLEPFRADLTFLRDVSTLRIGDCIHGLRYLQCWFCSRSCDLDSAMPTLPRARDYSARDYSPDAVDERNPPEYVGIAHKQIQVNQFVRLMNKRGFRDSADSYLLPESLSRDLFKPPTTPSVPTSRHRVPAQVASNHMPSIGGQTRSQSGVFSIRVKTEWATDHEVSAIKPLFSRNERYNGPVIDVDTYCSITCRPSYSERSRLEIDSKLFRSKFAPSPLKRLAGERIRNEVFEPTTSDIQKWKDEHTKDGEFKQKSYGDLKFNSSRPSWEFRPREDETPPSGHVSADRATFIFERVSETGFETAIWETDFATVESGVYDQDVVEIAEPTVKVEGNPYKIARSGKWTGDSDADFVREIMKYSTHRLRVYDGRVPEHLLHPQLVPYSTTSHVSYAPPQWRAEYTAEQNLKNAADFDSDRHKILAHYYEYGYRYYLGELRNLRVQEIWNTVRETTIRKTTINYDNDTEIDSWDETIRNTFGDPIQLPIGELTIADVIPLDGFYTRTKISILSPTWAYLVLPLPDDSLFEDDGEGLEETDEGFESPVPKGLPDVQVILRKQADQTRSRKKQKTVRRLLRDAFHGGDIAFVRFRLVGDRLEWDAAPQTSATTN